MTPTLHEIAAMPYPASIKAVRRYYDQLWGKLPDPDGPQRPFKVEMDWEVTHTGTFSLTVSAGSQDEAELLAGEQFEKKFDSDHEVSTVRLKELLQ